MHSHGEPGPTALLVTRNFPPLLGGMEKVNEHLLAALRPDWEPALCGPAGCRRHASGTATVAEARVKPLPLFLLSSLLQSLRLARKLRPSWIIAGSGLAAPAVRLAAWLCGARAAVYLHGLDLVAPSRAYQWLWLPFIRRCDLAWVNSANTARLARERGVPAGRIHVLHPGTDLPALDAGVAADFRQRHELAGRPLLLSVGRLTQRKGLVEFVEQALPAIVAASPGATLVVIGDEASDALHARPGSERERILAAARKAGVEAGVRFLGRCDDATLGAAYQASDLHVFPVLDLPGDVEGFGMVALESAAHGLRTVGFAVGGVSDAVREGQTGVLVRSGDYPALAAAVLRLLSDRGGSTLAACRQFAGENSWTAFGQRLRGNLREAA
ncbi:MAG: glycosyltransferase family 1 protein [Lysobacteraceae bacterium]|nr:MAG: glycosyltransferase family 1 protein [Xanthomonadaceae bacterium]